jgi:hypothetical protein
MVERKKVEWTLGVVLKEGKRIRIMLGAWNSRKNSQTLLGLVVQFITGLATNLRIW